MERDPRPFQAVNIGMTSVETGRERFFNENFYNGPPLSAWRCNLTALSQRYNLYFIATRECIAVYQPEFPFQKLSRTPKLNIPPTLANDTAAGYIDEWRPHGINHLMVGDLGSEEILLAATDSGNVTAYHTKAVEEAIKKDPYKFSADGRSDIVGLRAFFSQWVHESAWGLAIHCEGRMIAVSANKPHHVATNDSSAKVTVFAFALTNQSSDAREVSDDRDSEAPEEQQDWYDWDPDQSDGETPHRDRNFKIILGGGNGHINNIPSVSFVNNMEDPDGSWILSTDITGIMKLWRIWRGSCYASYDCEGTHLRFSMRRQRDAGWIVAALDPSAFRPAMSTDQFCGYHRPRSAPQYQGHPGESYDITNIVRLKTPGRSQKHPLIGQDSDDDRDTQDEEEEIVEEWTEEEMEEPDRKRDLVLGLNSLRLPTNSESTRPFTQTQAPSEPPESEHSSSAVRPEVGPADSIEATDTTENNFVALQTVDDGDDPDDINDEETDSIEQAVVSSSGSPASHTSISSTTQRTSMDVEVPPGLDTSPEYSVDSSRALFKKPAPVPSKRQRHDQNAKEDNVRIPSITALQCSQFHVRLINIPKARSPHFFCANILTQDLPEGMERSNFAHLSRLSMMQQIPELGIVIIASQLGRCAVCTMTKNVSNDALGLRVDWILPTRRQERAGYRPMHPLLGIAVAPVQGRSLQGSDPTSEQEDHDWAKDGTVNGVKTTFDRTVLVLDKNAKDNKDDDSSSDDEHCAPSQRSLPTRTLASAYHRGTHKRSLNCRPQRKRLRHTPPSNSNFNSDPRATLSSLSSQASTSSRPFLPLQYTQSWAAIEPSRRYRLMLTYLDMTVLTYELERGVEREDVKGCESWRSQSQTSASGSGSGDIDDGGSGDIDDGGSGDTDDGESDEDDL